MYANGEAYGDGAAAPPGPVSTLTPVLTTQGARWDRTLYADSPPPSLPEFGWKVPDHGRQRRPKENLLDLVEVKKMVFTSCVYTQNTQFFQENPIMDETQIGPNINITPTPVQKSLGDGPYPSG